LNISKEDVVRRYVDGQRTKEIAEIAGCSTRYITQVVKEAGVSKSDRRRPPTYKINEEFFRTWSAEMAYVLGFIITDGCISGSTAYIYQKDRQILERINGAMSSNYPIHERKNGASYLHSINISRKSVVEDLKALGVSENKSLITGFPDVPAEFMSHFIRGVFDGDGWIQDRGYVANVTSGSFLFATQLQHALEHFGVNAYIKKNSGAYRIWVSGKEGIKRLSRWLYADSGVLFMPRKRERFELHVA